MRLGLARPRDFRCLHWPLCQFVCGGEQRHESAAAVAVTWFRRRSRWSPAPWHIHRYGAKRNPAPSGAGKSHPGGGAAGGTITRPGDQAPASVPGRRCDYGGLASRHKPVRRRGCHRGAARLPQPAAAALPLPDAAISGGGPGVGNAAWTGLPGGLVTRAALTRPSARVFTVTATSRSIRHRRHGHGYVTDFAGHLFGGMTGLTDRIAGAGAQHRDARRRLFGQISPAPGRPGYAQPLYAANLSDSSRIRNGVMWPRSTTAWTPSRPTPAPASKIERSLLDPRGRRHARTRPGPPRQRHLAEIGITGTR